jgi:hypothetical protein
MVFRNVSDLAGIILAILWAVAQFLLIDKISIAVGADGFFQQLDGMSLGENVNIILNSFGMPSDLIYVPVNLYSLTLMFLLIVIAIVINFVVGLLQLTGVDTAITVIFGSLFGTSLNNIFTVIPGFFDFLLTGNITALEPNPVPFVPAPPVTMPSNLQGILVFVLEQLGIMNVIRIIFATSIGDYFDAQDILMGGVFTGVDFPINIGGVTVPPVVPTPVTVLGNVRALLLGILGQIFTIVQTSSGAPFALIPAV